jgi:hypothetical protein
MKRCLPFALLALLGACGDLPQPYRGNAGGLSAQLVAPPGSRVAVPRPAEAMLDDASGTRFAEALAEALRTAEVPAVAAAALPLDWRVDVRASRQGVNVVPRFVLIDADGREQGTTDGRPVPVQAWAEGAAEPLRTAATAAAPRIAELMLRAEAARKATNPAALASGGPPRLRVVPVSGAPGDGNTSLTARLTGFLTERGFVVSDSASGANFAVQGLVSLANVAPGRQRIELIWIVSRRDGEELGRVIQINEIASGSLNGLWGDVAYAAAQEAAGGVRQVVSNAGGMPAAPAADGRPAAASPVAALAMPATDDLPAPRGTDAAAPAAAPAPAAAAPAAAAPAAAPAARAQPQRRARPPARRTATPAASRTPAAGR